VLTEIEAAKTELQSLSGIHTGHVRVGAMHTMGPIDLSLPIGLFNGLHPRVEITVKGKQATVRSEFPHRREAALVGTFAAHLRNMIVGVTDGFTYEMKIVYSHFPLKATVKGSEFIIENFLGEKFPRKTRIIGETKVEVQGDAVVLTGSDVEAVGQTAANIEQATRIRGFDSRIFQDGIYITKKAGEALNG